MISIRKQLFGILASLGLIVILATSLMVNFSIKRNFENYIEKNIQQAGDVIVDIVEDLYENDGWQYNLDEKLVVETYMGNFAISILDCNKQLIWGTTQEQLHYSIKDFDKRWIHLNNKNYRFEDRSLYDKDGHLIGYVRIGYYPSLLISESGLQFQAAMNEATLWCSFLILGCFIAAGLGISKLFTFHIYGIAKTSMDLADGKLTARYTRPSHIQEIETLRYSMNYLAERLEKQDTIRKKLISDVSHEIRTPLHILQSNLEAMIDGIYPIDDEQMQMLYKEVVRFGKLLSNLDMLKNVEEKAEQIEFVPIQLNQSIREVFNSFKIIANEKKIKYSLNVEETEDMMILGDKDAIKQLWMNLLSNAFKFTEDKGEIKVTTSVKERHCTITIEDTGIGIAKEDLPYVFDRMYRGDKSREIYEGSGLGLTIVKKIVKSHHGKVSIESEQGVGSKIYIQLPLEGDVAHQHRTNKVKSYMRIGIKN